MLPLFPHGEWLGDSLRNFQNNVVVQIIDKFTTKSKSPNKHLLVHDVVLVSLLLTWTYFSSFSSVCNVDFEHEFVCWTEFYSNHISIYSRVFSLISPTVDIKMVVVSQKKLVMNTRVATQLHKVVIKIMTQSNMLHFLDIQKAMISPETRINHNRSQNRSHPLVYRHKNPSKQNMMFRIINFSEIKLLLY